MIEMITKGGKKIGEISDDCSQNDSLVVKGRRVNLEDVYSSDKLTEEFNSQEKELNDVATEDQDPE